MSEPVRIVGDGLVIGDTRVQIRFMRTLRIPETGTYPLPPGMGLFPLRRVADYGDAVPAEHPDHPDHPAGQHRGWTAVV